MLSFIHFLFNYGLFNNTVNISGCEASNAWMFGE